jgi:hypothetical protein
MKGRMSYKLFDQGYTPEEIKLMKESKSAEDHTMEELRRWKESEHVLNILRKIEASQREFTKMELAAWRKATRSK